MRVFQLVFRPFLCLHNTVYRQYVYRLCVLCPAAVQIHRLSSVLVCDNIVVQKKIRRLIDRESESPVLRHSTSSDNYSRAVFIEMEYTSHCKPHTILTTIDPITSTNITSEMTLDNPLNVPPCRVPCAAAGDVDSAPLRLPTDGKMR